VPITSPPESVTFRMLALGGNLLFRNDRYWRIVLKKSAVQLFGMLQRIRRA
jgi:hypothetical protein